MGHSARQYIYIDVCISQISVYMCVFVFACYLWGAPFATSLSPDREPPALRAQSVLRLNKRPSATRTRTLHPRKSVAVPAWRDPHPGPPRALQCRVRELAIFEMYSRVAISRSSARWPTALELPLLLVCYRSCSDEHQHQARCRAKAS